MMHRRAIFGTALLLCAAGWAMPRAVEPAAAQRAPREQRMPAVAFNNHPEVLDFLMVWVEDRGSGPDIYSKRLSNNGLPQGGPAKSGIQAVRTTGGRNDPAGPRSDPSLTYNLQQEEYLMVYSEDTGEPNGWDVFAVRVSNSGYGITPPRLVAGGEGDQQHPDVEILPSNDPEDLRDYLVVFDDNVRDIDRIMAVRLRGNGIPVGKPYELIANRTSNATDPTTNGTAVAWVDDVAGQTDIWALRLNNGKPQGMPYRLAGDNFDDDFAPRYGGTGLVWNIYDPGSGADIRGVEVYANNRVRGNSVGILVPAADQSWPDSAVGTDGDRQKSIVVFADNRSGEFDLYAVRTTNFRIQGREFPVMTDSAVP